MSITEIIELISLIIATIGMISTIIAEIAKGKMKSFILEKMEEAEASGKDGDEKLLFVISEVKKKYKIAAILLNIKEFVEKIISVTKKINYKG